MPEGTEAENRPAMRAVEEAAQGLFDTENWSCKKGAEEIFKGQPYKTLTINGKDVHVFNYRDGDIVVCDYDFPLPTAEEEEKYFGISWEIPKTLYFFHVKTKEDRQTLISKAEKITA